MPVLLKRGADRAFHGKRDRSYEVLVRMKQKGYDVKLDQKDNSGIDLDSRGVMVGFGSTW